MTNRNVRHGWPRRAGAVGIASALLGWGVAAGAAPATELEESPMLDPAGIVASNIPQVERCLVGRRFVFRSADATPADATGFFFVRFGFEVPREGEYRLSVDGHGPGSRAQSRYSCVIDDGPVREMLCRRVVTPENGRGFGWHEQPPVKLAEGNHVLELRFLPDQRVRAMNRLDAPWQGHAVEIEGIRVAPVPPAVAAAKPRRQAGQELQVRHGQTIVFFGDSITDEGFYPRHVARLLAGAYPAETITCINAGIAMNRTWEGVERIERDVLALKPDLVVLAFGVNDSVHMSPGEFARNYEQIIRRLTGAGIRVLCTTPSGMLPALGAKDKVYFHAPDRAAAFDRTMAYEAADVLRLARKYDCASADILGALCQSGLPRAQLMASQWHPGEEGGRLMALAILRALGFTAADAARTGDPADAAYYQALAAMPTIEHDSLVSVATAARQPLAGRTVAASSFSRNEVAFFSADTGREVGRIPVGHHPVGLAHSPKRQRLYVACEGVGRIDVVQLPDLQTIEPIALGDVYPVAVVLSDDENTAWTGNFFGCSISEVDLDTGKVRREIKLGALVEGLAAAPGGSLLAATRKGIMLVDTAAGTAAAPLLLSPHHDAFWRDPAGVLHAVDTVNWQMARIGLPELTAQEPVPCPWQARAALFDPAANRRWTADWRHDALVGTATDATQTTRATPVEFCFGMAIIPAP